jgi:chemotaxis signal transduction protein
MLPLNNFSAHSLEQMSDDDFWNYARERAGIVSSVASSKEGSLDQYLECELSRGNCLIPLKSTVEVVPPPHRFARLPINPHWMPGLVAWRGEIIAVIDLDMYLYGMDVSPAEAMLLVTEHNELVVGLLVPGIGLTTTIQFEQMAPSTGPSMLYTPTRAGVAKGVYAEAPVLDVPALLTDVVQQIGMAAYHG